MKLHLIYKIDDKIHEEFKDFDLLSDADKYLEEIGATYWEIGLPDDHKITQE